MKLFGINIGSKPSGDTKAGDEKKDSVKKSLGKYGQVLTRHQAFIITLAVVAVLALTTLQMLRFADPLLDEEWAAEKISQLKRIKIDDNVVEQIKQLQDSNATAKPNVDEGRTNPFTE